MFDFKGFPIGQGGLPAGYISGLILTNGTTANTMLTLGVGVCRDKGNQFDMVLGGALVDKVFQASGAWSAGSSGNAIDTGALEASKTYHIHAIVNLTTGAVDFLASLSATAPTIPSGYHNSFRRVGAVMTNGSSQIIPFKQDGNLFLIATEAADIAITDLGTTAALQILRVPTGVKVRAIVDAFMAHGTASTKLLLTSPDQVSVATTVAYSLIAQVTTVFVGGRFEVLTDTSGRIRAIAGAASTSLTLHTVGWIDPRGQNG